jgi:hypothetical protein
MKVACAKLSTLLDHVAISIKYLEPTREGCGMIVAFGITFRQGLIAINVNEVQLVQLCQRSVVGI